ncbi:MAG: NAD(P)H-hydrate dehydratase [Enterococcus sp.]
MHLTTQILKDIIKPRPEIAHKGTFGRVVLVGGDEQYGGAILMSAEATINSGAGLTTVVTAKKNHAALHARLPEAMVVDWTDYDAVVAVAASADVLLVGPGLGTTAFSRLLLNQLLTMQKETQYLLLDGSALTLLGEQSPTLSYPKKTVLTPHQMEWQRVSGIPIEQQTVQANHHVQKNIGATVVLKSHRTTIYGQKDIYQNPGGSSAMSIGGTGDTLAGMIAGFLAQFPQTDKTIAAAVFLHSYIGDYLAKENYVVLPTKISAAIPYWMHFFSTKNDTTNL